MSKSSAPQSGILLLGDGALRINDLLSNLKTLSSDQMEMISRAKKYAMDQSIKSIQSRGHNVINSTTGSQSNSSSQQTLPRSSQRHQALVMMCRVYVGSLSFELKEESVKAAFSPYGAVKSVNMTWDTATMKHKGFAFVEYELPEGAQLAIDHMNGIQLCGRQIRVGRPSNMPQADPVFAQIQEECRQRNRIYVSNVHEDVPADELAKLFDPFGVIKSCKLAMKPIAEGAEQPAADENNNKHRGYGFIEFDSEKAALEALTMDNFELIEGQNLHVCAGTTPPENVSLHGTLEAEPVQHQNNQQSRQSSNVDNHDSRVNGDERSRSKTRRSESNGRHHHDRDHDHSTRSNRDDRHHDDARSSSPPRSSSRRHRGSSSRHATSNGSTSHGTSVLVLCNMVSPDEELDESLLLDVYEECAKHGPVSQVLLYIDKKPDKPESSNSSGLVADEVRIFIKYQDGSASERAREALNGRFFAGRKVSAEHYDKSLFRHRHYLGHE